MSEYTAPAETLRAARALWQDDASFALARRGRTWEAKPWAALSRRWRGGWSHLPIAERRKIAAQLLDTATYRHEHGITRHATLDDPEEFRVWLASLPPEEPLPGVWDDPLEAFLRSHGDPTACLVEVGDEGWQHYRSGGVEDEIPSWAFYLLGWWTDTATARGALADFTAYWADWKEGQ